MSIRLFFSLFLMLCNSTVLLAQGKSEEAAGSAMSVSQFVLLYVLAALAALFCWLWLSSKRKQRRLLGSEQLLLNILPQAVATELSFRNAVAARRYEKATVMFADFVGFTRVAEQLSPEELVAQLDHCFSSFDAMLGRRRIEKIKTSGDAYICACGLSDRNENPNDMLQFALEIQEFMQKLKEEHIAQGRPYFEARIGIHFGPVVAGVVGVKKFAYDIWGDTVNLAARMEETSEPGFINVSETVHEQCQNLYRFEPRGHIVAKNKGQVAMYFLKGKK
jgi:adenylate cyclase